MATGIAMIVDKTPTPEAAKPTLATESAVSNPSTTLAPRRYFLYSEALKSRLRSSRNLMSSICWSVVVSGLKWRVEADRNILLADRCLIEPRLDLASAYRG